MTDAPQSRVPVWNSLPVVVLILIVLLPSACNRLKIYDARQWAFTRYEEMVPPLLRGGKTIKSERRDSGGLDTCKTDVFAVRSEAIAQFMNQMKRDLASDAPDAKVRSMAWDISPINALSTAKPYFGCGAPTQSQEVSRLLAEQGHYFYWNSGDFDGSLPLDGAAFIYVYLVVVDDRNNLVYTFVQTSDWEA